MAAPHSSSQLGSGLLHAERHNHSGQNITLRVYHQQRYRQAFFEAVARGDVRPLTIPWSFVGAFFLPLLYLSIPHTTRPWLYRLRWVVVAAVIGLHVRLL